MFIWRVIKFLIRIKLELEIDDNAKLLCTNQLIKYQQHIGGGNYVSVTSGLQCVNFRQFYMPLM